MSRREPAETPWPAVALGVLGAAASWLAARSLPLPPDHALRGTLAVLPLTLGALAAVDLECRRLGGRRLAPRLLAGEAVALVLLVAASLSYQGLGLPELGPVLAASLFALAGLHAAAQIVALRPVLGRRVPLRPPAVFFVLPLVLYLLSQPWVASRRQPDGDEPYYLLLAHSLAFDHDVDLANNYAEGDWRYFMERPVGPQPGDPRGPHGEVYSRHNALLPLVLALPYRLAGRAGTCATMALLAAALAWLTLRLAGRYAPERPAEGLLAYGVLALAPPLFIYAHQVWVEVPAALALAAALDRVLAVPRSGGPEAPVARGRRTLGWLALLLPLIVLPALKFRFALLAAPLAVLAGWRHRRSRLALAILAGALGLTLAVLLAVNEVRYGNPLKVHIWKELDLAAFSPASYARGLAGLFWDSAFGLFAAAPIWLLAVPAALYAIRRRLPVVAHLTLIGLPYLVLAAPRAEWYGGWSPPFRYGVALLPLVALVLAPLLGRRRRPGARVVLAALGLATVVLALAWLAEPGLAFDLADGRTHLLDALTAQIGADVARFFPSYVRPRLASWLWPPLSAALVTWLWWLPRRRRDGRAPALRRLAPTAGATALFLAAAALPALARLVPTRVAELEDPWIAHRGGHLHPETWVVARSSYRGAWVIRPGESVEVPLVAGGERFRLRLELRVERNNPDPVTLQVFDGHRLLTSWSPPPRPAPAAMAARAEDATAARDGGDWRRLELGPFEWRGGPLGLRTDGPPRASGQNGILLDRLEVEWR